MTCDVTASASGPDILILPRVPRRGMRCEFCDATLPSQEPENVVLLEHVRQNEGCHEQFQYALENIRSSWTANMSGG